MYKVTQLEEVIKPFHQANLPTEITNYTNKKELFEHAETVVESCTTVKTCMQSLVKATKSIQSLTTSNTTTGAEEKVWL
jgi:hypothetical protein